MDRRPTAADRDRSWRSLTNGLVALVALSAALSGVYGGASVLEVGLLGVVGAAVGVALVVALGARP